MSAELAKFVQEALSEAQEAEEEGQESAPEAPEASESSEAGDNKADGSLPEGESLEEESSEGDESGADSQSEGGVAESQKSTVIRDYLKGQLGYDLDDEDDDESLAPTIGTVFQERNAALKELEQLKAELQKRTASEEPEKPAKQEAPELPSESSPPDNIWGDIPYDTDWERAAEFDAEAGEWVPKGKFGSYGEEAARSLNDYTRRTQARARRLTENPVEAILEAGLKEQLEQIRSEFEQKFNQYKENTLQEVETRAQRAKTQAAVQAELDSRRPEFMVTDKKGNPLVDPLTGEYRLTERGEGYLSGLERAKSEYGIEDPVKQHNFAMDLIGRQVPEAEEAEEEPVAEERKPQPKESSEEKKKRFLDRGKQRVAKDDNRDGFHRANRDIGEAASRTLSLKDMILSDPDNAEFLGHHFKG